MAYRVKSNTKTMTRQAQTAADVRRAAREGMKGSTAGLAPGHVQANLIILPNKYAQDFRNLCLRNPVACPLLAETRPGETSFPPGVADGIDIRTDVPGFNVYIDGKRVKEDIYDIKSYWAEDSVAFLIGCSFSFENALIEAGLVPRHIENNVSACMFYTKIPLMPSGVFGGHTVVSMRPYLPEDLEKVRAITRPYITTHGEPIAWGWDALEKLGISDINKPDEGSAQEIRDGEIPVFWACGVTPQLSVLQSPEVKGTVMGHTPGSMVVLDIRVEDVVR